jgi:hypothetical protein
MIDDREIGITIQGDVRPETADVAADVRRLFPRAQIVFSTFQTPALDPALGTLRELADAVIVNDDPGALPPTVISPTAPANNINRQLVSTSAGLAALNRRYALKLRSDARLLSANIVVAAWAQSVEAGGDDSRLAACSLYTRHPRGLNGYLFHVSDWMTFGALAQVRRYWGAPQMPLSCATWFEHNPHHRTATATARRFRARFTQEQWLCIHYAAKLGYQVPEALDHRTPRLIADYERFLAERWIVLDTSQAGLYVPAHRRAETSLFQRLDCVSHADWCEFVRANDENRPAHTGRLRWAARLARRPIGRALLARKWLKTKLAFS